MTIRVTSGETVSASTLAEPTRREPLADLLDRGHVLELLERGARRQPHPDLARGHRRQPSAGGEPVVAGDLVALERDPRPGRQLGREEPGIEAPRQRRRRHPARQRHEPVGPQSQVELGGDRREAGVTADQRRSGLGEHARPGSERPRGRRRPAARRLPRTAPGSPPRTTRARRPARGRHRAPGPPPRPTRIDRRSRAGDASASSTRPPGKTCMSGANAIDGGRRVSRTSNPDRPCRSRTTVAAGTGTTDDGEPCQRLSTYDQSHWPGSNCQSRDGVLAKPSNSYSPWAAFIDGRV